MNAGTCGSMRGGGETYGGTSVGSGGFFSINEAKYYSSGGFPGWIKIILIILLVIVIIFASLNIAGYAHVLKHPEEKEQISRSSCYLLIAANALIIFISVIMIGYMIFTFFKVPQKAKNLIKTMEKLQRGTAAAVNARAAAAADSGAQAGAITAASLQKKADLENGASVEKADSNFVKNFKIFYNAIIDKITRNTKAPCPAGCQPIASLTLRNPGESPDLFESANHVETSMTLEEFIRKVKND